MGKVKKRVVIVLSMLSVLVILLLLFFIPFAKTQPFVPTEYGFALDYSKELINIPTMSQQTPYTCNVTSMAIVKNYLGFETSENDVREELDLLDHTSGMLPKEYLEQANTLFAPLSYSVSLQNPTSQTEILTLISASLENELPVVILYSAKDDWNQPSYNTHYAVIYGIDMEKKIVKSSNPYGYLEELSFTELFEGLDFTSYQGEPFIFRLGRKVGMIQSNNLILFEKKI